MKKSKLRYLGFLGLVGLAGVATGQPGLFGFFGFFGFFAVTFQQEDELLRWNLARAGLNGFVASLVGLAIAIALVAIQRSFHWLALMVGVVFALQVLAFTVSLVVYERGGSDE